MFSSVAERGRGEFSYHLLFGCGREERAVTSRLTGLGGRGGPPGAGCLAGLGGRAGLGDRGVPSDADCSAGLGGRDAGGFGGRAGLGDRDVPSDAGCSAGLGGSGSSGPSGVGCLGGSGRSSGADCLAGLGGDEVEEAPDDTNRIFPGFLGATGFLREGVLASFFCLLLLVSLAFLVGGASLSLGGQPPFLFLFGLSFSFPSL